MHRIMRSKLTQSRLKELLHYNPETGIFTWKASPAGNVRAGATAGCRYVGGYIHINIDKSVYRAHRLAFLYMEGYVPEHCVDHIDRNPSNNKWSNLREVSHQCNSRNRKVCVNSKSGITGVIWYKDRKKWVAHIKTIEKLIFLGYFDNKLDAAKARWEAEKKYGYPNCCVDSSSYLYIQKHKILDKENSEVRYA